ncbi:unnamed protein product [Rotaria sp. Silwood1]|nr:unnamed protein product [Rotaria sp. Silwood1]
MVTYSPFFPLSINTTYKGSESEFSLKISDQFVVDMSAWVTNPIGRLENCEMGDSNECSYLIKFILNGIGVHSASVKYKDRETSGSRYECTARSIEGDGTHKIGASYEFIVYTHEAGIGRLVLAVEGPAKAKIDIFDRKDGSCDVSCVCSKAGQYVISIKFNHEHIPNSPFRVIIGQTDPNPDRVDASGAGLYEGVIGQSGGFLGDTTNAATGVLKVTVNGPTNVQPDCKAITEGTGVHKNRGDVDDLSKMKTILSLYTQRSGGELTIHRNFNTIDKWTSYSLSLQNNNNTIVDASRVRVHGDGLIQAIKNKKATFIVDTCDSGNAKLTVDVLSPKGPCKEVFIQYIGKNQYYVEYIVRKKAPYYMLIVKWDDQHIPGSPWHINVVKIK